MTKPRAGARIGAEPIYGFSQRNKRKGVGPMGCDAVVPCKLIELAYVCNAHTSKFYLTGTQIQSVP